MRLRVLVMVAVMLLAACSDDDAADTTAAEGTTTTAAEGTTTTTAAEGTTTTAAPTTTEAPTTTTTTAPEPAGPDLNGTWVAELTHVAVEGPCPSTPTQRGPVVLTRDGDRFALTFPDEDFDCDPVEACAFTGTFDGSVLTGENSGPADEQGGIYRTAFTATWDGADRIEGAGQSTYTAEGVSCVWDTALVMVRE